jgi:hypothetical protein
MKTPSLHEDADEDPCHENSIVMPAPGDNNAIDHLITVIPARDEARSIGRCLESITAARSALAPAISTAVVVVVDSCRDDTALIAAAHLDPGRDLLLYSDEGSAGASRGIGVAAALERTALDPSRIWMCSTDADSTVPADWFDVHLEAARHGHIAIAGIVDLDDTADPMLVDQFTATYHTHDDGSHQHVHGANLGFRADAYLAAGGWSMMSTGEDHDLWGRLTPLGATIASVRLSVSTASRLIGRAPAGFAANLTALTIATAPAA